MRISSKLFLNEGAPVGNTNAAKDHDSKESPKIRLNMKRPIELMKLTNLARSKTVKALSFDSKKSDHLSAIKAHKKASKDHLKAGYKEIASWHKRLSKSHQNSVNNINDTEK